MVKRNPIWVRLIAGAAFVYAWVLIAYTPHKHKSVAMIEDGREKQQLTSGVDDNVDATTGDEAILQDTPTEPTLVTTSKTVQTSNALPTGTVLLVDDGSDKEKSPTRKADKHLETDRSEIRQNASGGRESQMASQSIKTSNKNRVSDKNKISDQTAVIPQTDEADKTSTNLTSEKLDNSVGTNKNDSERTNSGKTVANVPSADSPSKEHQSNSEAEVYPKAHNVAIMAPGVCPENDVITIVGGGRLANCIWEYVTVWSLSRFLPGNRTPFAQKFIVSSLNKVFDGVTLPTVEELPRECECCKTTNWTAPNVHVFDFIPLDNVTTRFADFKGHIILSKYSLLLEPVLATIEELKKEFRYKDELVMSAREIIRNKTELYVSSNKIDENSRIVYVGVHVRRTDYIKYLSDVHNMTATGPEYFVAAMDYFRKRTDLGTPVFLVVSDDVSWAEKNLKEDDVFVVSRGGIDNPGYDIALLSHCNHSIIDYGTYGLWAAVYAGGETVTMKTTTQTYRILGSKPNWHFVQTTPTGDILIP